MKCPRCQAQIDAADVNLEHLLAKCRACQEVFRFSSDEIEAVSDRVKEHEAVREYESPAVFSGTDDDRILDIRVPPVKAPRPESIEVEDWGGKRRIVRRWFVYSYFWTLAFCIVWDGFLVFWYTTAFWSGSLLAIFFPVLHVCVGVFLTYSTIAGFFNRSVITLREEELEVWHGPVPSFGNLVLPAKKIKQMYCLEEARTWGKSGNFYTPTVTVNAMLENGATKVVVRSLSREEGLFVEQQLEEWMNIAPQRVPGQID
jgi:hypothetical protein